MEQVLEQSRKKIHYSWWILIGLCVVVGLGRGGLNNSGGLFLTPITEDLGIGMGSLSLYFSIASIVTMICLPIAGKLIAKYDIRAVLITAIILQAGSFALFGFMNTVWGWYILSIPMAFGAIFITQMAGPVLINQWFKKSAGLAIGIMMAASGAAGAIIQPIIGNMIGSVGWRSTYTVIGLAVIIIAVPVVLFIIRRPQDKQMLPYGVEDDLTTDGKESQMEAALTGISVGVAKKSTAFYALILFFFLITSFGSFAMHIPTYAMGLGHDVAFAGSVMSAFMVGMLVGSLVFGFSSDKIGAKNTALLAMLTGLVSVFLLIFFAQHNTVLIVAVGLFGFVTSSLGTLGPVLTSSIFGNKDYSQIFSMVSLGLAVAGIVALPIYGYVFEFTGSYTAVLYAFIAMLVIGIGSIIIAFKGKDEMVKAGLWK